MYGWTFQYPSRFISWGYRGERFSRSTWEKSEKDYYKKWNYTPAVRSKISSKLIFASCVWYSDRAYYELCVLIKDIGRRLPLQLQCSFQGQQGDFSQSVRGNYKTRSWGGQNLTAVEGNVSFYQVNPVSRITGEGGGVVLKDVGAWFWSKASGVGGGGGQTGGQFVRVSYKSFQGDKSDGFGVKKQKNASVYHGGGELGRYIRGSLSWLASGIVGFSRSE